MKQDLEKFELKAQIQISNLIYKLLLIYSWNPADNLYLF